MQQDLIFLQDIPVKLVDGATFAYHEDGLTEFIGSPEGHQARMSSASVERQDMPQANGIIPTDIASAFPENASEPASVSVSTNTHCWVDNLVGSETADIDALEGLRTGFADRISPTPLEYHFEEPPTTEPGNDTSYGLIGTSTARDLVRDLRTSSPQNQYQSPPRPTLPSILNSPFAPQPGEESPHSRPSTAKRMTTHSKRNSENGFAIPRQPLTYSVDSSVSAMQDPSGTTFEPMQNRPHGGYGHFGVIGRPLALHAKGKAPVLDESVVFHSSSVFGGSPWDDPRPGDFDTVDMSTPPGARGDG